jgi:hypothetical protein
MTGCGADLDVRRKFHRMTWFSSLFHRSAVVRLTVRGVVFAFVAYPFTVLALKLQPVMPALSSPAAMLVTSALVLIEASAIVAIRFLFRRVR